MYKFPIMSVVEYYYNTISITISNTNTITIKQNYGYHSVVISAFIKKNFN